MARFYVSGHLGNFASGLFKAGGRHSVADCHVRGWDAGVEVETVKLDNGDAFDIYMTGGSHKPSSRIKIGRVEHKKGDTAPIFLPSKEMTT
jgi:hypothetical protein